MKSLIFPLLAVCFAPETDGGGAAPTEDPNSDAILRELFGPASMVDAELVDEETILDNIAAARADAFYLETSRSLRADFDSLKGVSKAEIKADLALQDKALRANGFRMMAMSGPETARTLIYYVPPKKAAKSASETVKDWKTYISHLALERIYPILMQEIDILTAPAAQVITDYAGKSRAGERGTTEANCSGLPADVKDAHSFYDLCDRFQINYVVSDERWVRTEADGKKKETAVSLGWRADKFRPERKVEEVKKAEVKASETPTTTPPAPAE